MTLKLVADANRKAHVFWGRKDLGVAPLEIRRPRGSGPLDLVFVAPGFLPLHTRAFTDHDETLSVRLYDEAAASGLLGHPIGNAMATPHTPASFSLPTSSGFTHNARTFPGPGR